VCVCTYINCCQCVGVCMYVYVMYVYVCVCVGVHLCGSVYKCVCPVAISGSAPFSTFPGNLFPWRFVYGYKELPESEARDYSRHSLTTTAKFNWIFYLLSIFTTQILANLHLNYLLYSLGLFRTFSAWVSPGGIPKKRDSLLVAGKILKCRADKFNLFSPTKCFFQRGG